MRTPLKFDKYWTMNQSRNSLSYMLLYALRTEVLLIDIDSLSKRRNYAMVFFFSDLLAGRINSPNIFFFYFIQSICGSKQQSHNMEQFCDLTFQRVMDFFVYQTTEQTTENLFQSVVIHFHSIMSRACLSLTIFVFDRGLQFVDCK